MATTNENESYIVASIKERKLLEQFAKQYPLLILHVTKPDGYDTYDALVLSGFCEFRIEIKNRSSENEIGYWNGYTIEEPKYQSLIKQFNEDGIQPLYVVMNNTGAMIWNLKECTPPVFEKKLHQVNNQKQIGVYKEKLAGDMLTCEAHMYKCFLDVDDAATKAQQEYNEHYKNKL